MKTKYIVLFILAILAVAAVVTSLNSSIATAVGTDVVSKYVAQDLPLADPDDAMWDMATPADVPLSGQVVIAPTNEAPSVTSMRIRSLNNAQWIAFLLEWDDPTKDVGGGTLDFKDSAAIQFPSQEGQPFVCMGVSREGVEILHWRSDFQQDIEAGLPNASAIFPNMWVNIYPGGDDDTFSTGLSVGNPLSLADKTTPVEDLLAGGFGTLTSETRADAVGWAKWNDGKWKAVIARPMTTIDAEDAQFSGGMETSLALAAWDGGKREINGKKSVSTWVSFGIESAPALPGEVITVPAKPAPSGVPEIVVQNRFPKTTMVAISLIFAAIVITASGITWVIARRS